MNKKAKWSKRKAVRYLIGLGLSSLISILFQRNYVFTTNSDFLISISLQPNVVYTFNILNYEIGRKELSLWHKLNFSNPYICGTWCCRLLIFQTKIIWCNKIHSMKYLRSTSLGCKDIGIKILQFVAKT